VALPLLRSSEAFTATGFAWRFLFSLPRSNVGWRDVRARVAPQAVINEYEARMGEMLAMPESAPGATADQIPVLLATSEASEALRCFEEQIEPRLRPDSGDLAVLGSWGHKLAGQIVRIAGLLHASKHRARPWESLLDLETMKQAVEFEPYFVAHAKAACFELDASPEVKRAQRAVQWMRRWLKSGERYFTRSELHKAVAKNRPVTEIDPLLLLLTKHGAVRGVETSAQTGGRPRGPTFELRPDLNEVSDGE